MLCVWGGGRLGGTLCLRGTRRYVVRLRGLGGFSHGTMREVVG